MRWPLRLIKMFNYHYWPWPKFYIPLFPVHLFYAAKSKSFTYFTALNPGLDDMAGLIQGSKEEYANKLPLKFLPKQFNCQLPTKYEEIILEMNRQGLHFPVVGKPDRGTRGKGVRRLDTSYDLKKYIEGKVGDFLIQEFIDLDQEWAVFTVKSPKTGKVRITSLTRKRFLKLVGDGVRTVEELLTEKTLWRFQIERLTEENPQILRLVLSRGEELFLEPIGNHSRGTEFVNYNHAINPKLEASFKSLLDLLEGVYYGRFDVKTNSIADMENGNFKIIEINGVLAEPVHIYDEQHNVFKAYRDMIKQWGYGVDIYCELKQQERAKTLSSKEVISKTRTGLREQVTH